MAADLNETDGPSVSAHSCAPEAVQWMHDALERMFDLAFLDRHAHAGCAAGRFPSGRALHNALQQAIKQLRPPVSVSPHSPAWRIYHALNLRYAQGLSQAEVAAELGMSVRHFKRVQDKAIYAATAQLLEPPANDAGAGPSTKHLTGSGAGGSPPESFGTAGHEFIRFGDLLPASVHVVEPLLNGRNLRIQVVAPPILPVVQADRILARQLLISALSWLTHGVTDTDLQVRVDVFGHDVVLHLYRPALAGREVDEEWGTVQQLAGAMGIRATVTGANPVVMELRLPVSETRCVLLVEDNADAVGLVERYLEHSGEFHLVAVRQPGEALRHAIALRPACILLDVMMPEHDGWEVLSLLKANPETAHIPVVISSVIRGYDLARALGAAAVLPKPFGASDLIEVLRSVTVQSAPTQPTAQTG